MHSSTPLYTVIGLSRLDIMVEIALMFYQKSIYIAKEKSQSTCSTN